MESIPAQRAGQPEYAFNDQHSRDGKGQNSAEVCLVKKVLLTHTSLNSFIIQPESYGANG